MQFIHISCNSRRSLRQERLPEEATPSLQLHSTTSHPCLTTSVCREMNWRIYLLENLSPFFCRIKFSARSIRQPGSLCSREMLVLACGRQASEWGKHKTASCGGRAGLTQPRDAGRCTEADRIPSRQDVN